MPLTGSSGVETDYVPTIGTLWELHIRWAWGLCHWTSCWLRKSSIHRRANLGQRLKSTQRQQPKFLRILQSWSIQSSRAWYYQPESEGLFDQSRKRRWLGCI